MDLRERPPGARGLLDALVLVAVGGAMAVWTWGGWADILVDFGRELYVPWRIVEGETLYGDVAYFNGPLSPYLNALWFRLFGPGLWTLQGVNLALVGLLAGVLYHIQRVAGGRISALFAAIAFLLVFAFGQRLLYANYNFVAPYSHELTHGVLLLLLGITCVERFAASGGRLRWVAAAALCAGSTLLTKPEIVLASLAVPLGLAAGVALLRREDGREPLSGPHVWRVVATFLGCVALPPAIALLLLGTHLPWTTVASGLTAAWSMALEPGITSLPFYRAVLGLDAPWERAGEMTSALAGMLFIMAPGVIATVLKRRGGHTGTPVPEPLVVAALFLGAVLVTLLVTLWAPSLQLARAIPAILLMLLAWTVADLTGGSGAEPDTPRAVTRLGLLVLSLLLCSKMVLATRVDHYGFALAMPGTVTIVAALVGWLPDAARRAGRDPRPMRIWALGALLVLAGFHLMVVAARTSQKPLWVGAGRETIRTDTIRGPAVQRALTFLSNRSEPRATALVLPEGSTLNFLSRAPSPTPYINFMPPELIHFGEARMLEALRADPPGIVVLVHKDPTEYGRGQFGQGYGRQLLGWVTESYRVTASWGDPPFRDTSEFGIQILERKP